MSRFLPVLIAAGLIAWAPVRAADEPDKKQKTSGRIERAAEKTGAALGRTAERAERGVKKGVAATEKAINTAGKKTGQWLNEKTK